jgi:hypothetical protein
MSAASSGENGPFDFTISTVRNAEGKKTTDSTAVSVLDAINDGIWREPIEELRRMWSETAGDLKAKKEAVKLLKEALRGILWHGKFSVRNADGLQARSGLLCLDFDKLKDLTAARIALENDPYVVALFLSPTGTGLKVLVRIDPCRPHLDGYKAAEIYFKQQYGLDVDPACKDVCRLCFVSWDPDLYRNPNALPLPYPEQATISATGERPESGSEHSDDGVTPLPLSDVTPERVKELLGFIPPRPDYHDWLRISSAVWSVMSKEQGYALLSKWSPEEKPGEYDEKWKNRLTEIRIGTLYHYAKLNGWRSRTRGSSESAKPFSIWSPAQFLEWQPPADACLLGEGLVERSGFTSLVGIGGLGKSRISLQLAIAQILGREWCGLPTHGAPATWLFISPENGISRWKTDLTGMLRDLSESERATVEKHLRLWAMIPEEDDDVCLADPLVCGRLAATLAAKKPDVVVFDPLADMIDGDESKTVDMVATLRRLRSIVRANAPTAAVLVIHHSRTGAANVAQAGSNFDAGNFARGAKALYSRVRCELQLAPADKDDSNRLVLACGKASNGPRFKTRGVVFDPETFTYAVDPDFNVDAWRDDVAGKRRGSAVTIADTVTTVRELYQVDEDVSTGAIVGLLHSQTGACAKSIQRRLKDAASAGYVIAGSKRGTWRLGSKPLKP